MIKLALQIIFRIGDYTLQCFNAFPQIIFQRVQLHMNSFEFFCGVMVGRWMPTNNLDPDGLCGQVLVQAAQPLNDATVLLQITVRIDWASRSGPRAITRTIRVSRMGSS